MTIYDACARVYDRSGQIMCALKIRRAQTTITGFVQRGALYERFQETHVEQAYPRHEVAATLEASGFQLTACYTCFSFEPAGDDRRRIMWVARKRSEAVR